MSAAIGPRAARTICFRAAVDSASGQETRTMSAPASSQRRIWSIVPLTSAVEVLGMVCTLTGAAPPTGTLPTMIWRDWRRSISRQGRMDIFTLSDSLLANIGGFDDQEKARSRFQRSEGGRHRPGGDPARGGGRRDIRGHALGE